MKTVFSIIVMLIFIPCLNIFAHAEKHQFTISVGYVQPLFNIKKMGNEFFAPGIGQEWEDIIGLKQVGGTYFISGSFGFVKIKNITLEAEASYWQKKIMTKPESYDFIDVRNFFSDISLGVNGIWKLKRKMMNPFLGGGISFHFLKAEINPVQYPELSRSASKNKIMLSVLGGSEFILSKKLSMHVSARFDIHANLNQWKLHAGLAYYP